MLRPNASDVNEVVHTGGRWVRPQIVRIPPLFGDHSYITRYVLFRTPPFGIYIHRLDSPDGERHPHNHPRVFWSTILRGGYVEKVIAPSRRSEHKTWRIGSVHRMPLGSFHSIVRLLRVPTWSLLIVGPWREEWGFDTPDGFVGADDYKAYIEMTLETS